MEEVNKNTELDNAVLIMDKTPELGTNLTSQWIQTSNSLLNRFINNFKCKVCGHVGKVTIITSHPIETICESCQRDEKIENLLEDNVFVNKV